MDSKTISEGTIITKFFPRSWTQYYSQTSGEQSKYFGLYDYLHELLQCMQRMKSFMAVTKNSTLCYALTFKHWNGWRIIFRLALVFREGIHTFQHYASRGLCADDTFLKTTVGKTLLVSCFCNGNMQLQIVAIAVVSIESQDNWFFFLKFLLAHLIHRPAIIVSDRDKGLIPSVRAIESIPHYLNCFRHILENFNRKFKSKQLKTMAWNVARALM